MATVAVSSRPSTSAIHGEPAAKPSQAGNSLAVVSQAVV